jgi:glutamate-1-semialdehyde 2,1-aminomutase
MQPARLPHADERFRQEARALIEPSRPSLAGGVSSPVRAGTAVGGAPFVQERGSGAYAFDAQGRRYVDYVMA